MYYPRIALALPLSSNSDPRSHSGPSSPLPTTVCAFILIARIRHTTRNTRDRSITHSLQR